MGGSSTTVGFRYYLGVHAAVCVGPVDAVTKLDFDERTAWEGEVTANGRIGVYAPELFGGDKREGGVVGSVDILMGEQAQGKSPYLMSQLGTDIPAYRGVMTLVFRGFEGDEDFDFGNRYENAELLASMLSKFDINNTDDLMESIKKDYAGKSFFWASLNPYIKPFAPTVKRILKGWTNGVWNAADAAIGDEMNPAHIIYQCLTDPAFGLGISATRIGSSFDTAADTLLAEEFGLSLMWTRQESVEEFIGIILTHIDATLYEDRFTGLLELKLVRDDYDVNTLQVFGPDEITTVESFSRPGWGETVNEVIVQYTNRETNEDAATVNIQDLANIRIQGGVVNSTRDYPGINSESLARRVAARDLRTGASPLASIQFKVNRSAWNLPPGFVFKFSWPDYNVSNLVCRVLSVDYGDLDSQEVTINAVEDVFALPDIAYGDHQQTLWVDPTGVPQDIVNARAYEATWVEVVQGFGAAAAEALPASQCFVTGVAEKPTGGANVSLEIGTSLTPNTDDFSIQPEEGDYTPSATVAAAVGYLDTVVSWSSTNSWPFDGVINAYAYWDDEIVLIQSVDANAQTITMKRGCHDTVPQTHSAGSRVWVFNATRGYLGVDSNFAEFAEVGESVYLRFLGRSLTYTSALASAPQTQITLTDRWLRPYPPADVKIDAQHYPGQFEGAFEVTWVSRNRLTQDGRGEGTVGWVEAPVLPEDDTTYTLEVYDNVSGNLIQTIPGLEVDGSGNGSASVDVSGTGTLVAETPEATIYEDARHAWKSGSYIILLTGSARQQDVGLAVYSASTYQRVESGAVGPLGSIPANWVEAAEVYSGSLYLSLRGGDSSRDVNGVVRISLAGVPSSPGPYADAYHQVTTGNTSGLCIIGGNVWHGRPYTAGGNPAGIYKLNGSSLALDSYFPTTGESTGGVKDLATDGTDLYATLFDNTETKIVRYTQAGVVVWSAVSPSRYARSIIHAQAAVWVLGDENLEMRDAATGALLRLYAVPGDYSIDYIDSRDRNQLTVDSDGVVVVETFSGFVKFDPITGAIVDSFAGGGAFAGRVDDLYALADDPITTSGQTRYPIRFAELSPANVSRETRIELYAVRAGLASHQRYIHTMFASGYGFDYGGNYGGQ